MTGTSVTTAGIVCPGFGVVSDEPPDDDALKAHVRVQDQLAAHLRATVDWRDLTMELEGDPACVKAVRQHTAAVLAAWGLNGHIPDATLVVSELVTNALCHAAPADTTPGRPILLRLVRRGQDLLCLVADASDRPPVLAEADFAAETGRGLHLVAAHSRRWDWVHRRHRPGKWVWALLSPPIDTSR
jgi:anti-sigma regulatory factor (Ser/Thr protein kinase)